MAADPSAAPSAGSAVAEAFQGTAAFRGMALRRLPLHANGVAAVMAVVAKASIATRAAASTGTGAYGKVPATVAVAGLSGRPAGRDGKAQP